MQSHSHVNKKTNKATLDILASLGQPSDIRDTSYTTQKTVILITTEKQLF